MYRIRRNYRIGALLAILTLLLTLVPAVLAAETASASTMQLTRTEGTVSAANASGRSVSIREKMRIYNGYTITTAAKSYAWIALDDTKLVKLDASSEVAVRKNGKSLELLVSSGSLLFNVTEPLKEDEKLNICTATMVAGVRGTTGWVEARADGSGLAILEGRVVCNTAAGDSASVESGQSASFSTGGEIEQGKIDLNETPGFVLTDVVNDPALCAEILEKSGLDIGSVTPEQAAAKQAKDETAAAAVEAANQSAAQQSASDNSSDSSSSGGSSNPTVPQRPNVTAPDESDGHVNPTDTGDFVVTGKGKYSFENNVLTIISSTSLAIKNKDDKSSTSDRIEISENATGNVNITLAGVTVDTEKAALLIPSGCGADVTVILAADTKNDLKSTGEDCAALQKDSACILAIEGPGALTAYGGKNAPGIGRTEAYDNNKSNIVIKGGVITATGGDKDVNVPGIGGDRAVSAEIDGDALVNIRTGYTILPGYYLTLNRGIVLYITQVGSNTVTVGTVKGTVSFINDAFTSLITDLTVQDYATLSSDAVIPASKTLTVPQNTTLEIPEDYKLTIESMAKLLNEGTIHVDGEIKITGAADPKELKLENVTGSGTISDDLKQLYPTDSGSGISLMSLFPDELDLPENEDDTIDVPKNEVENATSDDTNGVDEDNPADESKEDDEDKDKEEPKDEDKTVDIPKSDDVIVDDTENKDDTGDDTENEAGDDTKDKED